MIQYHAWRVFASVLFASPIFAGLATFSEHTLPRLAWWSLASICFAGAMVYFFRTLRS